MRILLWLGLFVLISAPTLAQSYHVSSDRVDVCPAFLQGQGALAHQPADDVNLNSFSFNPAQEIIHIPLALETFDGTGLEATLPAGISAKPDFGTVDLYPDGRVFYKGQQLSSDALQAACQNGPVQPEDIIEGQFND